MVVAGRLSGPTSRKVALIFQRGRGRLPDRRNRELPGRDFRQEKWRAGTLNQVL